MPFWMKRFYPTGLSKPYWQRVSKLYLWHFFSNWYQNLQGGVFMQRILSTSGKALRQSILVLGMILLILLWILFIAIQPTSYATTLEELKLIPPDASRLTPQEKIDRAYELSEGAGIREEER
jgi:hypothetical protein